MVDEQWGSHPGLSKSDEVLVEATREMLGDNALDVFPTGRRII
jgi:hypothetical protein